MEEVVDARTVKEFMEWFVSEYDGHWLPSDLNPTINRLEGFSLAKANSEEHYILSAALSDLRSFRTLLINIQQYSKWKYK
jgi:hypothetical protein